MRKLIEKVRSKVHQIKSNFKFRSKKLKLVAVLETILSKKFTYYRYITPSKSLFFTIMKENTLSSFFYFKYVGGSFLLKQFSTN